MKFAMLLFAALASSAFAHDSTDPQNGAKLAICESANDPGNGCYTLALQGAPVDITEEWSLRLVDVKDSRCPRNVTCIWAGTLSTTFQLSSNSNIGKNEKFTLSLDPRGTGADVWVDKTKGLEIQLNAVTPLQIGRPPMPTRYYASIHVTSHPLFQDPGTFECPHIMRPAICSFGDIEVSGSNSCIARKELIDTLKEQGINYDSSAIKCQNHDI